jgi:hypothetical protein
MRFVRLLAALAAFACVDAAAQPARAVDPGYVLNVPVNISKLGPGHRAEVACSIGQVDPRDPLSRRIDNESRQSVPVALDRLGNFSGTIVVKFPGAPGVNRYRCFLLLDGNSGNLPPHTQRPILQNDGAL